MYICESEFHKSIVTSRVLQKEILALIDRKPNVRILQNNVTLESKRYTAEVLYKECLDIA